MTRQQRVPPRDVPQTSAVSDHLRELQVLAIDQEELPISIK
jgi:hypothetical protein